MARGIKLFKVVGIQVSIDYTWFIVFVLFAWSLAFGYFPFRYPGFGRSTYLFMGFVSSFLLFACVLIHELSHSYTSNRLGLEIKEITLFIFGGVAQLTKEPEDALVELKIAVAGPLASGVLSVLFWSISKTVPQTDYPVIYAIFAYLAMINVVLMIFNMIPGFPLDGGRVLRAIWWYKTGDLNAATRVASRIGKGFAIFLIIMGFLQIATGNFTGGIWSVFIGVFLQQAAESGYQQLVIKRALEGLKVSDVMSKGVVSVEEDFTVQKVVDEYFFKYHYASFPVKCAGSVTGILTLYRISRVDKERWPDTLVKDVMHKIVPDDVLGPNESALDALTKLTTCEAGRCPVIDRGSLVGILSRSDIMKLMEFKAALKR